MTVEKVAQTFVMKRRIKSLVTRWVKHVYKYDSYHLMEFNTSEVINATPSKIFDLVGSLTEDGDDITGEKNTFIIHLANGTSEIFQLPIVIEKNKWIEIFKRNSTKQRHTETKSETSSTSSNGSVPCPSSPTLHSWDSRSSSTSTPSSISSFSSIRELNSLNGSSSGSTCSDDPIVASQRIPVLNHIESFDHPVVISNINGTILGTNSICCKMFGYDNTEMMIGKRINILMPEPYQSQHDCYLFRHEKFGQEKLIGNPQVLPALHSDGSTFEVLISLGKLSTHYFIATFRKY